MQHLINIHFRSSALGARLLSATGRKANPNPNTAPDTHIAPGTIFNAPRTNHEHGSPPTTGEHGAAPAMLYFVFNRDVVGVVVAHDLERGEFVAQVGWLAVSQDMLCMQ
jgi:hypothetical protein